MDTMPEDANYPEKMRITMCESKTAFDNLSPRAIKKMYVCPFCGKYHITTKFRKENETRPSPAFFQLCHNEKDAKNRQYAIHAGGGIATIVIFKGKYWLKAFTARERKKLLIF